MIKYAFRVFMNNKSFVIEIKSASTDREAWYLIEKQFDDADCIDLLSTEFN